MLEEEDQQGLAHLLEHMAFNGTENFEKMELINYLESIGMDFGPEINAYTSFEETVYMLEIPTDDRDIMENAFQVLEDWAHLISLEEDAIEAERPVIREEWRLGRGASGRILDEILPVLLKDSRFAERLPIGKVDVFMKTPAQRVRDFYSDWYRPELMAVVAVGDFDSVEIRSLIETHFSYPSPGPAPDLPIFPVPPQELPRVKIVGDPEVTLPSLELAILRSPAGKMTEQDYRDFLVRGLFWNIFNQRLEELSRREDPPFLGAGGGEGDFVSTAAFVSYNTALREENLLEGIEILTEEIFRAQRYGVLEGELFRAKEEQRLFINRAFKEKDNLPSPSLARELADYYLEGIFMPGIEEEHRLTNEILPEISLEEINDYARTIFPRENRILTLILPETVVSPGEEKLLALLEEVEARPLTPPKEESVGELPQASPEERGAIIERHRIEAWEAEEWILSNGARIVVKPTDFMEDQILFYAFSPGGLSLVEDPFYHDGLYSSLFLRESGLGEFSAGDLEKALAGRDVSLSPFIGDYFEGFSGSASPAELELLLRLTRLYFTDPRFDQDIFENLKSRLDTVVKNRLFDPDTVYQDRLQEILTSGAYRKKPLDSAILDTLVLAEAQEVYSQRFAGAGDFTFLLVGNVDPALLEAMVTATLGSLPGGNEEEWVDRGIRPPEAIVEERVEKGLDPKGRVTLVFPGEGELSKEEKTVFNTVGDILQVRLRELLREELGGTYSVRVSTDLHSRPVDGWTGTVSFGCDPERTEELSARVFEEIERLREGELDPSYLEAEKEQYRRDYEVNLEENGFWLGEMADTLQEGETPEPPLSPEAFAENLTMERTMALAARVFDTTRWIRLVLVPEDTAE